MGLMGFLASPLGSIVAGAAETAEDQYWNITLPRNQEAADAFKATVLSKLAKRQSSINTGNAINSELSSKAKALKASDKFARYSIDELASTIQLVKDSGLAKSGEEVSFLLNSESNFKLLPPKKSTDVEASTSEQTKNLMKFTPSAKVEDVLAKDEPRSLFQEYFYGKSTRSIQESVLKEMGYTPKQYAELTSVPVMKKLGLSPAVIQFSEKYSLDPIQVSNRERVMKNADDQLSILGANQVLESYENKDGDKVQVTASDVHEVIVELSSVFDRPLSPDEENLLKKSKSLLSAASAQATDNKALNVNLDKLSEQAQLFSEKDDINYYTKLSLIGHLNALTQNQTILRSRTATVDEREEAQKNLRGIRREIQLIMGRGIQGFDATLDAYLINLPKITKNLLPQQVVPGTNNLVTAEVQTLLNQIREFKGNFTKFTNKEEQDAIKDRLLKKGAELSAIPKLNLAGDLESTHKILEENALKLNGTVTMPGAGGMPDVDEDVNSLYARYNRKINDYFDGKISGESSEKVLRYMQGQLMSNLQSTNLAESVKEFNLMDNYGDSQKIFKATYDTLETFRKLQEAGDSRIKSHHLPAFKSLAEQQYTFNAMVNRASYSEDASDEDKRMLLMDINARSAASAKFAQQMLESLNQSDPFEVYIQNHLNTLKETEKDLIENAHRFEDEEYLAAMNKLSSLRTLIDSPVALTIPKDLPQEEQEQFIQDEQQKRLSDLNAQIPELLAIARTANDPGTKTTMEEKVDAIFDMEDEFFYKQTKRNMTPEEERIARINIKGMLASGNIKLTKKGPALLRYDAATGEYKLTRVDTFTGLGNIISLEEGKQFDYKEKIKAALNGEARTARLIRGYIEYKNVFNILGEARLLAGDIADVFGSLNGPNKTLFGDTAEDIAAMQKYRSDGIALLGEAKDILFNDPRLSDQDLAIVRKFIVVLENSSLLGTTRGQAALMVIQGALTKDAMIRQYELDFDKTMQIADAATPLDERITPGTTGYADAKFINNLEKRLGFKIGKDAPETYANKAFYRLLNAMGVDKIPSVSELKTMKEQDPKAHEILNQKLTTVVTQMQFVMNDIYNYVADGPNNKDRNANEFLATHSDLEFEPEDSRAINSIEFAGPG